MRLTIKKNTDNNMGSIVDGIGKIFKGISSNTVDSIKGLADELFDSKEEKRLGEERLRKLILEEKKADALILQSELTAKLEDKKSARDSTTKIQQSQWSSWMAKNVPYILDLVVVVGFICLLFMMFFKGVPATNQELFYIALGITGTLTTNIFGYHRGSSSKENDVSAQLEEMKQKNE